MKPLSAYIYIVLLCSLVVSCTKNELAVSGVLSEAAGQSLDIVYRASDKEKSFLVEETVPLDASGKFSLKALTRYPTVLWILSANQGTLLMPVYAERGEELTIEGKYSEPRKWKVEGNKVMEQYCQWAQQNINALMSDSPSKLNEAIAAYVKKNPDSLTAAFILLTHYNIAGHEDEFNTLSASLKIDDEELSQMRRACMAPDIKSPAAADIPASLSLTSLKDSLTDIPLKGKGSTLLYFWREAPEKEYRELLGKSIARTGGAAVCVFMDIDTIRWHQMLHSDTILNAATNVWAPGGEVNRALRPLHVPTSPYIIVTDDNGKVTYRGQDTEAASLKL